MTEPPPAENPDLPLVTVVVPALNVARYLRVALDSILRQDYPRLECIVVDAGSTDATHDILRSYGDRIRWTSRPDRGAFDAINDGWQMSEGEILAWLNADDTWEPKAVGRAVTFLQAHAEVDVVYGDCGGIDDRGRLIWFGPAPAWDFHQAVLACDAVINQPSAFMRRSIVEKAGWLYPAWCHDHELWLRIELAGGRFAALHEHLANARIWGDNLHMNPRITIPAKLGITRRVLADPRLPVELEDRRARVMSNAYLRCLDFLPKPRHWIHAPYLLGKSFMADPSNTPRILEQFAVHAGWTIPFVRERLRPRYGHGYPVRPR